MLLACEHENFFQNTSEQCVHSNEFTFLIIPDKNPTICEQDLEMLTIEVHVL